MVVYLGNFPREIRTARLTRFGIYLHILYFFFFVNLNRTVFRHLI